MQKTLPEFRDDAENGHKPEPGSVPVSLVCQVKGLNGMQPEAKQLKNPGQVGGVIIQTWQPEMLKAEAGRRQYEDIGVCSLLGGL